VLAVYILARESFGQVVPFLKGVRRWLENADGWPAGPRPCAAAALTNCARSSAAGCSCRWISRRPGGAGSFSPSRVFWLFLSQVLDADHACRSALLRFLGALALAGKTASTATAGYCRARARLPLAAIEAVAEAAGAKIEAAGAGRRRWCGRLVKVADGSTLSLPDTPENQRLYPQPKAARPGCGFPLMRIVALFSLETGVMLALAKGAKTISERRLLHSLWPHLNRQDVLLADRGFCSYAEIALLRQRAVDVVLRALDQRKLGKGKELVRKLGAHDCLVRWIKTGPRPAWLELAAWQSLPQSQILREVAVTVAIPGFRTQAFTVVTTLLDPAEFSAPSLAQLYRRRWRAELFLRDIKCTLGMDILRCRKPAMVHKELVMHRLAYNLIRALMLEADARHGCGEEKISFKGAVAISRQWAPRLARLTARQRRPVYDLMLRCLARDLLPQRPNRSEPRARKRRPKDYQLLTRPRHLFKETPHKRSAPATP
jgi:hypothetical protein